MRAKSGFTLVEILIVVVILGILAAIVIPQFTGASTEAKESSLVSDLQTVRSQIELYKIQHNSDIIPGEVVVQATGSITASSPALFVTAMCSQTDKNGVVGTTAGTHIFGPYMKRLPPNPFSSAEGTTVEDLAEDAAMVGSGAVKLATGGSDTGWYIVLNRDAGTGQPLTNHGLFQSADGLSHPTEGTAHVDY